MNNNFNKLAESVLQIKIGSTVQAKNNLKDLIKSLQNIDNDFLDLQYFLFSSALLKRIDGYTAENIYLQNYDEISQIDLFQLLSTHVPFVSLTHPIANELICQILSQLTTVTLLNIGIGKGLQEVDLLKRLVKKGIKLQQLTIVGIEPSQENLLEAESNILKASEELDFDLKFIPFPKLVEDLSEREWLFLASLNGDIIINEAFSLHHIVDRKQGYDTRQEVILKISRLNPMAFILVEPNWDHNISDLWYRFKNAWINYRLLFEALSQVDMPKKMKFLIINNFFGREIEDVLGNCEETRCERHESVDIWLQRLYKEGFKPFDLSTINLTNFSHPVGNVVTRDSYIGIECNNTALIAIIAVQ
ncbi:hypothetical protein I8748_34430 [Nostoc sp. CENA67]|uniref:Uncharacterized protein n=1 Tax=Amazonocrinis nigriterrae CENA67 TaxID=2794033 RepID=A0A8J7I2T5_9NOST|nr:GRAS family protein [Amazonocrinis nigriterrae]MBH8567189.1 hypothetical protein [Amazonocrinis nigriterrae CENA67]